MGLSILLLLKRFFEQGLFSVFSRSIPQILFVGKLEVKRHTTWFLKCVKLGKNFKEKKFTFLQEQDSQSLVKRGKESESTKVKAKETSGKRLWKQWKTAREREGKSFLNTFYEKRPNQMLALPPQPS